MKDDQKNDAKTNCTVIDVTPELLKKWLDDGTAVLVDVREDFEHASERIPGAQLHPLSTFEPQAIQRLCADKRIVFHCRSGKRATEAAKRFHEISPQTFNLAGGIEGWKAAGQKTERAPGAPKIDIMRQVQIVAGSLVLLGVLLGYFVSPWFLILSGFIGAGLTFAGLSGWCGMALLLANMPWNRRADAA